MKIITLLGWLACCLMLNDAGAANLKPEDFAYAMPLTLEGNAPIYRVVIPLDVYVHATQPDLGDVRIFNGAGEALPYAVRAAVPTHAENKIRKSVPIFPLYGNPDQALQAVRITLERPGSRIEMLAPGKNTRDAKIESYLLDARGFDAAIDAVELSWSQGEPFAFNVQLESSEDLAHWRSVANGLAVADLRFSGQALTQRRLEFPATQARFFRLSWPATGAIVLDAALAESRVRQTGEPAHELRTIPGTATAANQDIYEFDVGGAIAVDRVNLKLPEGNNLVRAEVQGRRRAGDPWMEVANANFYQLDNQGTQVRNPALTVGPLSYRYWRVHVQPSGSLGSSVPALEVRWLPHQLYFIARGAGPFQLAFGRAALAAAPSAVDQLLDATTGTAGVAAGTTIVGPVRELGGARQLVATRPVDWKTGMLWGALITGVLLLGLMAMKLSRDMKRAQ